MTNKTNIAQDLISLAALAFQNKQYENAGSLFAAAMASSDIGEFLDKISGEEDQAEDTVSLNGTVGDAFEGPDNEDQDDDDEELPDEEDADLDSVIASLSAAMRAEDESEEDLDLSTSSEELDFEDEEDSEGEEEEDEYEDQERDPEFPGQTLIPPSLSSSDEGAEESVSTSTPEHKTIKIDFTVGSASPVTLKQ